MASSLQLVAKSGKKTTTREQNAAQKLADILEDLHRIQKRVLSLMQENCSPDSAA